VSSERVGFHVFSGVPPVAAQAAGQKLRQRLNVMRLERLHKE
jgi:hypothetical protein